MAAQVAVTPAGNPVEVPIPVAPVVVWEIAVNAVLTHTVGVEEATLTVLDGITIALWQEPKKYNATNIKMDFNTIGLTFLKFSLSINLLTHKPYVDKALAKKIL